MKPAYPLLALVLPLITWWVERHERRILREGEPLTEQALADAVAMGVRHPEKIRVLCVERIPVLNGRMLGLLARVFPAVSAGTIGLSLRYGIYVRREYRGNRVLLAHECVHTAQYEECGGPAVFLRCYFRQCLKFGYASAPMELEALRKSAACGMAVTS